MNRERTGLLIFLCWALSTGIAQAQSELRIWTRVDDQTQRAAFERVSNDGFVQFRGTGQAPIHFHALTSPDQTYVREQLEQSGQTDLIPMIGERREWTLVESGDTFLARFLRADATSIYLLDGANVKLFSRDSLSESDRTYAENTLASWASADDGPPAATEPESEATDEVVQGTPANAETAPDTPPENNTQPVGTAEVPKVATSEPDRKSTRRPPPLTDGRRPLYVPPSNSVASVTEVPTAGTTTFQPAGSSGGPFKLIAILLTILAIGAVVARLVQQRAQ